MKLIDITFKDMLQATRSLMAFMFMFVVPVLVTLLFYLMFGSASDENGFELPRTTVLVANLDEGGMPEGFTTQAELPGELAVNLEGAQSMGDVLVQILGQEAFADLLELSLAAGANEAREAVDAQEADVALIIPADFTATIFSSDERTVVELVKDPTLTIGPSIVEAIVGQILDGFAANKIGIGVTFEALSEDGVALNPELIQQVVSDLTAATAQGPSGGGAAANWVTSQSVSGDEEPEALLSEIAGVVLGGMMVFFAFFTGSNAIQSILTEEENGTLARLFTTPTRVRTILAGKSLSAIVMLSVQVTVLMIFGRLVFGIRWGDPLPVIMAGLGIVIMSAATGLLLVSLLKDTRQSGVVFGGLLTIAGMVGMMPVFTAGVPNQPPAIQTASLFVPHGWAVRGMMLARDGAGVPQLALNLGVILAVSLIFALVGQYRLERRFA